MPLTPEQMGEMVKTLQKLCDEAQALQKRIRRAMDESNQADRQIQTHMHERRKEPRKGR